MSTKSDKQLTPDEAIQLGELVLNLLATFDLKPSEVCITLYSTLVLMCEDDDLAVAEKKLNMCMQALNDAHARLFPSNPTNTNLN